LRQSGVKTYQTVRFCNAAFALLARPAPRQHHHGPSIRPERRLILYFEIDSLSQQAAKHREAFFNDQTVPRQKT
jgi:hypothetical protein